MEVIYLRNKEIGLRIRQAREECGLNKKELASKVKVADSTIKRYEDGEIVKIKMPVIESIANALKVNPMWLIGKTNNKVLPTLELYKYDNLLPISTQKIPLLGEISCGQPIFADEDRESYIESNTEIKADFCLKVKGDSMINARIYDGDIVFIRKQDMVNNGEIAAVIIEDEATLKRVYYQQGKKLMLVPENTAYAPLVYIGEELNKIRILGKAIAFQSDLT